MSAPERTVQEFVDDADADGVVVSTPEARSPSERDAVFGALLPGAVVAKLHGFGPGEQPLLSAVPGLEGEIVSARATVALRREQIGANAVVLFELGDPRRPIIVGLLDEPGSSSAGESCSPIRARIDDERLTLTAEREIVLQCGDASITLTRAGKVLINGRYVLSRSSGHNKIKGAAVDIN